MSSATLSSLNSRLGVAVILRLRRRFGFLISVMMRGERLQLIWMIVVIFRHSVLIVRGLLRRKIVRSRGAAAIVIRVLRLLVMRSSSLLSVIPRLSSIVGVLGLSILSGLSILMALIVVKAMS